MGQTYIFNVNLGGDDSTGDGSYDAPYLTIGKAMSVAAGLGLNIDLNAVILLGPGNFVEDVVWEPWVFLCGVDATAFSPYIEGGITLCSNWASVSGGAAAGMSNVTVQNDVVLDFTGTESQSAFNISTQAFIIGNLTVTGDPTVSGQAIVRGLEINGTTTFTGAQFESHNSLFFNDVSIVSTADQPAGWSDFASVVGGEFVTPNVTADSTAGKDVFVEAYSSSFTGAIYLKGSGTTYQATSDAVSRVTRTSGAPAAKRLTESCAIGYSPGAPSNWASSPPTEVKEAFDRLAAAVEALRGSPIP